MKKILAASALIASIGFGALSAEAKTSGSVNSSVTVAANASAPQIVIQTRRNRNWRNNRSRVRTVTRIRTIRVGGRLYRETIQIRYLPNGRTQTRVISRVRVR